MNQKVFIALILITNLFLLSPAFGNVVESDHVTVQLISDVQAFAPGLPFWVGIYFDIEDEWHIYWRNPGDTGLGPELKWDLPPGFSVEQIMWPYPKKIIVSDLVSFAYEKEVLLMAQVIPPSDLKPGKIVSIGVNADWLICREECIPGDAELNLVLSVVPNGFTPEPKWVDKFIRTRERLPIDRSAWELSAYREGNTIILQADKPDNTTDLPDQVQFFPYDEQIYDYSVESKFKSDMDGFSLSLPLESLRVTEPDRVKGILLSDLGWRGVDSEKALEIDIPITSHVENVKSVSQMMVYIIFAFLGGIILNLMPCVLPVLSLKVLGLIGQAGSGRRETIIHGLLFTSGVLVSFWILAVLLLFLRAGGEELGWGFQLQSPGFIFVLTSFLFLLGLSLFGVFEIGISLTGLGNKTTKHSGLSGSFISGIMATIVATPCTAPFMGSALGFAVTQPPYISILVFSFLGMGMAAPYLLMTLFPGLLKFVPKPGAWMESLKQFMGFLLMATVVWLIWVFGLQQGFEATIIFLAILLFLGIGAWIYGRWGVINRRPSIRRMGSAVATIIIAGSLFLGFYQVGKTTPRESAMSIEWEEYSNKKVESVRKSGQPVFIDFTAAWCLSCKVNERVAFTDPAVINRFRELNIRSFKADWTSRDDKITAALAQYGRNSVPLYVFYAAGTNESQILPEILMPGIVLNAIKIN
jgi:thiol:disulfide interchange protein/DsbC/DsbD-like thiol-disulfide interchange protein